MTDCSQVVLKYFSPLGATPEVPSSVDVWACPRCRLWQFRNSILQSRSQGLFSENSGYQRKARNGKRRKVKYYGHCTWKNWQVCRFIHPTAVSRYLGWYHHSCGHLSCRYSLHGTIYGNLQTPEIHLVSERLMPLNLLPKGKNYSNVNIFPKVLIQYFVLFWIEQIYNDALIWKPKSSHWKNFESCRIIYFFPITYSHEVGTAHPLTILLFCRGCHPYTITSKFLFTRSLPLNNWHYRGDPKLPCLSNCRFTGKGQSPAPLSHCPSLVTFSMARVVGNRQCWNPQGLLRFPGCISTFLCVYIKIVLHILLMCSFM